MNADAAEKLLDDAGLFFDREEDDEPGRVLNLSDAFYWACADCESVPPECMVELSDLFRRYGDGGVFYWVLKRRGDDRVEFQDVNRQVQFVRQEEAIRKAMPSSSKRAYHKATYTITNEEPAR